MNAAAISELQATAALLDDRAARIESAGDVLATRAATATWSGPAADRFRLLMVERRNELRAGALALRDAAHAVRTAAL
ncbi:MAG: hypothetical protein H0U92_02225 [Actinobacteria bacterium]|nr:hypothetical protein [Actinomycetota bacterium]